MKIGVLSDTHGIIHPKVFDLFHGTDLILHAGDVGREEILTELESLAPVRAVAGNTDTHPVRGRCSDLELFEIEGQTVYLIHRVIEGGRYLPSVMERIRATGPDIVVFGHTHLTHAEEREGIFFFNPGPAGHRREGTRLAVGILEIDGEKTNHRFHYLE